MADSVFNHSSNEMAETLLDGMQILIKDAVKNAGYDRTIQATILSCTNQSKGEYKCQYQDSKFLAYSPDVDVTYADNTLVFVLVPGNDWDATKTIIGTVDKLGKDYGTLPQISKFDPIGDNVFDNPSYSAEISSWYGAHPWVLYDIDAEPNPDNLQLNTIKVDTYLKQADFIQIKASFKSDILDTQINGQYGIRIYTSNSDPDNPNITIYEFNSLDMIGNPRHYSNYTDQYKILNFDKEHFGEITKIELFVQNYTEAQEKPIDIWITNFELTAQRELTPEELTDGYLSIITPAGSIKFSEHNPDEIILKAKIRVNGIVVEDDSEAEYYWFVQDASVYPGSIHEDGFCAISGARTEGWRCVNEKRVGTDTFSPASNELYLDDEDLPAEFMNWKCVAVYQGLVMENDITIENRGSVYTVTITPNPEGNTFYDSEGQKTLTCIPDPVPAGTVSYYWSKMDSYGNYTSITDWTTEESGIIYGSDIPLNRFNKYICTLYSGTAFLGSGFITLINTTRQEDTPGNYVLIIQNKSQVFCYDEDGVSSTDNKNENPTNIASLTFKLYDVQGQEIPQSTIEQGNVKWYFPKENSLLIYNGSGSGTEEGDYIVYGGMALDFKVDSSFNYDKIVNSQIQLKVTYDNVVVQDITDFTFYKQGDPGTNGTSYYCRIVPNTNNGEPYLKNRVFVREPSNGPTHWTFDGWTQKENEFPFKVEIFKGGNLTPIFSNSETGTVGGIQYKIKWSFPGATSAFSINYDTNTFRHSLTYNGLNIPTDNPDYIEYGNILRAEVEIGAVDAAIMYAFMPIGIQKSSSDDTDEVDILLKTTEGNENAYVGYSTVIYNADGENPRYSTTYPFDITDIAFTDIQIKGTKLYKDNNLIKPAEEYVGDVIDNAIYGTAGTIEIYIPILFTLNRYGLKALNAWDGTRIELDEEQGWILAPRIGAGKKEDDNSFTGAVMGIIRKEDTEDQTGIFAFGHNVRTFFVDANTGRTIFGKGTNGIVIDPNKGSKIYGGGYIPEEHEDSGLLIDLEEPCIKWGNGNFSVDSDGNTIIRGSGEIAGWRLYPTFLASVNYEEGINGGGIRLDSQQDSVIFGSSTGNIYSGLHQNFESTEDGFYLSGDGLSIGSQFRVDKTGAIYASDGYIGGYRILVDDGTDGGTLALEHAQNAWKLRSAAMSDNDEDRYYAYLTQAKNFIVSNSKYGGHNSDNDVTDECQIGSKKYPWKAGYFKKLKVGDYEHNYCNVVPESVIITLESGSWQQHSDGYYYQDMVINGVQRLGHEVYHEGSDNFHNLVHQQLEIVPTEASRKLAYLCDLRAYSWGDEGNDPDNVRFVTKTNPGSDLVFYFLIEDFKDYYIDAPVLFGSFDDEISLLTLSWNSPDDDSVYITWKYDLVTIEEYDEENQTWDPIYTKKVKKANKYVDSPLEIYG